MKYETAYDRFQQLIHDMINEGLGPTELIGALHALSVQWEFRYRLAFHEEMKTGQERKQAKTKQKSTKTKGK
jgi:hypothetical protein